MVESSLLHLTNMALFAKITNLHEKTYFKNVRVRSHDIQNVQHHDTYFINIHVSSKIHQNEKCYSVSFLVLESSPWERLYFNYMYPLMPFGFWCSVSCPHGTMGWSAVCDCGIS